MNIPKSVEVKHIQLQESKQPEAVDGWTDLQISKKPLAYFDQQIVQGNLALNTLQQTVTEQEQRLVRLKRLRARKLQIGGSE